MWNKIFPFRPSYMTQCGVEFNQSTRVFLCGMRRIVTLISLCLPCIYYTGDEKLKKYNYFYNQFLKRFSKTIAAHLPGDDKMRHYINSNGRLLPVRLINAYYAIYNW